MLELWQLRPPSSRCPYQFAEQFPHSFLSEVEGLAPGTSVSLKISTITGLPCVRPISDHRFNSCIALVTGRAPIATTVAPTNDKAASVSRRIRGPHCSDPGRRRGVEPARTSQEERYAMNETSNCRPAPPRYVAYLIASSLCFQLSSSRRAGLRRHIASGILQVGGLAELTI